MGYQKLCWKGEITLKRRVHVEIGGGGVPLFCYFTVQLHLLSVCWGAGVKCPLLHFGSSVFELTMQDSHPSLSSINTMYVYFRSILIVY